MVDTLSFTEQGEGEKGFGAYFEANVKPLSAEFEIIDAVLARFG